MGAALQLAIKDWPLWEYPWARRPAQPGHQYKEVADNPDVMCHFPTNGVLASQINREFKWLEGAWKNISTNGYQPLRFDFVSCIELSADNGSSYLVLDGNHRISAMHALGLETVEVKLLPLRRVRRADATTWPRVRDGSMGLGDALRIFDRYFATRNPPLKAENPAALEVDERAEWIDR